MSSHTAKDSVLKIQKRRLRYVIPHYISTQIVIIHGEISNWKSVLSGVPQGSVLGLSSGYFNFCRVNMLNTIDIYLIRAGYT